MTNKYTARLLQEVKRRSNPEGNYRRKLLNGEDFMRNKAGGRFIGYIKGIEMRLF
jgi:hypothetical protein